MMGVMRKLKLIVVGVLLFFSACKCSQPKRDVINPREYDPWRDPNVQRPTEKTIQDRQIQPGESRQDYKKRMKALDASTTCGFWETIFCGCN
jgi:thioredoxin-related protein